MQNQQQLQIYCRNVVFIYLGLVILVAMFGAWSILPTRCSTLGLHGTWSSKSHTNYSYEFRSNGRIDINFQGTAVKSFLTWERNGNKIWVMTSNPEASNVDNWTFIGLLHAGKITGMASVRGKTAVITVFMKKLGSAIKPRKRSKALQNPFSRFWRSHRSLLANNNQVDRMTVIDKVKSVRNAIVGIVLIRSRHFQPQQCIDATKKFLLVYLAENFAFNA